LISGEKDVKTEIINKCIEDISYIREVEEKLRNIDVKDYTEKDKENKFINALLSFDGKKRHSLDKTSYFYLSGGLDLQKKKTIIQENDELSKEKIDEISKSSLLYNILY